MKQSKGIITSVVKVPFYGLIGFFSRLSFIFFLPIGIFLSIKALVQKIRGIDTASETKLQPITDTELLGIKYYHKGHTWAEALTDGTVKVGFDYFTQKIMGEVNEIRLPKVGQALNQGKIAWVLKHGKRVLPQMAPINGTVLEVNEDLQKYPSIKNSDLAERGWVLKVKPVHLKENIRNLIHEQMSEKWLELAKSQFVLRFPSAVGPAYQDGGELIDGVGDTLTDDEWKIVKHEFFL